MTWLLTHVQWEIVATVGIVALGLVVWAAWRVAAAAMRALDDPTFWT